MEKAPVDPSKSDRTPFAWNFELQEKLKNTYYCGLFIDPEELYKIAPASLAKPIEHPHVTVSFAPGEDEIHGDLIGEEAEIEAIGYGKDEHNEGLLVRLKTDNEELKRLCDQIPLPHVTLSISDEGKAVDTAKLDFVPLEEPFTIHGVYGAFVTPKSSGEDVSLPPEIITSQT